MITPELYTKISNLIDSALQKGGKISSIISGIEDDWEHSEISSEDVGRIEFENYLSSTKNSLAKKHTYYPEEMLNFVKALQEYIDGNY